jgi:hypothetical protein
MFSFASIFNGELRSGDPVKLHVGEFHVNFSNSINVPYFWVVGPSYFEKIQAHLNCEQFNNSGGSVSRLSLSSCMGQ